MIDKNRVPSKAWNSIRPYRHEMRVKSHIVIVTRRHRSRTWTWRIKDARTATEEDIRRPQKYDPEERPRTYLKHTATRDSPLLRAMGIPSAVPTVVYHTLIGKTRTHGMAKEERLALLGAEDDLVWLQNKIAEEAAKTVK